MKALNMIAIYLALFSGTVVFAQSSKADLPAQEVSSQIILIRRREALLNDKIVLQEPQRKQPKAEASKHPQEVSGLVLKTPGKLTQVKTTPDTRPRRVFPDKPVATPTSQTAVATKTAPVKPAKNINPAISTNAVNELVQSGVMSQSEFNALFETSFERFEQYSMITIFQRATKGTGVSISRLFGHCSVETKCNPYASRGSAGEIGPFQIKPSTAAFYGCGRLVEGSTASGNAGAALFSGARCAARILQSTSRNVVGGSLQERLDYASAGYQPGWGAVLNARNAARDCDFTNEELPAAPVLVKYAVYRKSSGVCPKSAHIKLVSSLRTGGPYFMKVAAFMQKFKLVHG